MRGIFLGAHGRAPVSHIGDLKIAPPSANEVIVKIQAAALNPLDAKIARGDMKDWFAVRLPYVPGTDFAGIVASVGREVKDITPGDLVFGRANPISGGALASHIVIDASRIAHRPTDISAEVFACLPTPAGIALRALDAMTRAPGETLLVLGNGAVARTAAALAGHGAYLINSLDDLTAAPLAKYVFDTFGGALKQAALERLPEGGEFIGIVSPADDDYAQRRRIRTSFEVLETSKAQLAHVDT